MRYLELRTLGKNVERTQMLRPLCDRICALEEVHRACSGDIIPHDVIDRAYKAVVSPVDEATLRLKLHQLVNAPEGKYDHVEIRTDDGSYNLMYIGNNGENHALAMDHKEIDRLDYVQTFDFHDSNVTVSSNGDSVYHIVVSTHRQNTTSKSITFRWISMDWRKNEKNIRRVCKKVVPVVDDRKMQKQLPDWLTSEILKRVVHVERNSLAPQVLIEHTIRTSAHDSDRNDFDVMFDVVMQLLPTLVGTMTGCALVEAEE